MVIVKICGVTTIEDALISAEADMLGLNFYKPSPRYIEPQKAREMADKLRERLGDDCPVLVGVFVNESAENISSTMDIVGLDFAQLSGDEGPEMLNELGSKAFKAIRPADMEAALRDVKVYGNGTTHRAPTILVDAYHPNLFGGTGEQTNVDVALTIKSKTERMMLAGGLTPQNVGERVRAICPWGVDVASGVEVDGLPGSKDADKIRVFIDVVRNMEKR
jgi:phosphoribosylanthranilate isomerase